METTSRPFMSEINAIDTSKTPAEQDNNNTDPNAKRKQLLVLVAAIVITLVLCIVAVRYHHMLEAFGHYGLFGLFGLSVLNNATFMIPVPFASVIGCSVSVKYGALIIGLVMGLGGAIGEMTGYMAGYGGSSMLPNSVIAKSIERWVRKWGFLAITTLALVPNPFFDIGGVVAGVLHMSWVKFITAAWIGKGLRMAIMALACMGILPKLFHW
ncbi:MAG: VTT domain-containing protein [Chloroflexota bacterium]